MCCKDKPVKKFDCDIEKYPFELSSTAAVFVNDDDFLPSFRFRIKTKNGSASLPKEIIIYGKGEADENYLYINYFLTAFNKTVKSGCIEKYHPRNLSTSRETLCLGLPRRFRKRLIDHDESKVMDFVVSIMGGKDKVEVE